MLRDNILHVLHSYRTGFIKSADEAADTIAGLIENLDDGPLTTRALRSYLGAEIRGKQDTGSTESK